MDEEKSIYRLNVIISFRKCSLYDGKKTSHGNCTCFNDLEEHWTRFFYCEQDGIHLHCTKHPEIEFEIKRDIGKTLLACPKCGGMNIVEESISDITRQCLRLLNIKEFKNAKLIRLDDWYTPEVSHKEKTSDYWVKADVKTDRDGDTMIVLYVGHSGDREKSQFFIKPEKLQLTSDHKDMDPAKVLSKIEVTLKDRKLTQLYDDSLL